MLVLGIASGEWREYISNGPSQPKEHDFSKNKYGKVIRSFRDEWFNTYDCLEYSISKDAAYYFCCYLFKPTRSTSFRLGMIHLEKRDSEIERKQMKILKNMLVGLIVYTMTLEHYLKHLKNKDKVCLMYYHVIAVR